MKRAILGAAFAALTFAGTSALLLGQDAQPQDRPTPTSPNGAATTPPDRGETPSQERPGTTSPTGSQDRTRTSTPPRGNTTAEAATDSRTFINDMAIAGMAEVELGRTAASRASSADVKMFGQMMVTDHTKANDELKRVASQLNVQVPTQLDQKHRDLADRLSKLRGAEFDREYMNAMVEGHEEVVGKLRMRAGNQFTSNESPRTEPASADRPSTTQARGNQPSTSSTTAVGTTGSANDQALTQWAVKTLPTVQQHLAKARDIQQKLTR